MILASFPLKELAELKLTCKRWYFLISSPIFSRKYAENSEYKNLCSLIFEINYGISTLDHTNLLANNTELLNSAHIGNELPIPPFDGNYYCGGSSHGIVCLIIPVSETEDSILLWNPLTKDIRRMAPPQHPLWSPRRLSEAKLYWFGYVAALDDYIILVIRGGGLWFIYSLKRSGWNVEVHQQFSHLLHKVETYSSRTGGSRFHLLNEKKLCFSLAYDVIVQYDFVTKMCEILPFIPQDKRTLQYLGKDYRIVEGTIGLQSDRSRLYGIFIYEARIEEGGAEEQEQEEQALEGMGMGMGMGEGEEEEMGLEEGEEEEEEEEEEMGLEEGEVVEVEVEVVDDGEEVFNVQDREWLVEKCLWRNDVWEWESIFSIELGRKTPWLDPLYEASLAGFTFDDKIFVGAEDLVVVHPDYEDEDSRVLRVAHDERAVFATNHVDTILSPYWLHM